MNEKREAALAWLRKQGQIDGVTSAELEQMRDLVGNEGFGLLWGQIAFTRATYQIQLTNIALDSPAGHARASVLQGQIRAIDELQELVLSIVDPETDEDAASQEQEKVNGN